MPARDVPECIRQITGPGPAFYHMDAADRPALDRVFREHPIAAAVHLRAYKAWASRVQKPLAYYRTTWTPPCPAGREAGAR